MNPQQLHTIASEDWLTYKARFLNAFVANAEFRKFVLDKNNDGKSKTNACKDGFYNGFIWENLDYSICRKCSIAKAMSHLEKQNAQSFFMISDGRLAGAMPVFSVSLDEIKELIACPGSLWSIYVFDESCSWFVAFTDEESNGEPCFSNIQFD